ncbi:MAG: ATP-binding protein [Patescibacteria group bacterium]|nr:ATP-binding protein [Patescibacteria group bacterium]
MTKKQRTIKIAVDKSHLLTLGERMYGESIELIRELVNNAYDADATKVHIFVNPETIVVEDNGSGMAEKGLSQFFLVGSPEKRVHFLSPKFGRKRIGQFGIGKFSALSAADRFSVESKKGKWVYKVTFDRENWEKTETWELPISRTPATPFDHQGTKVVLSKLKRQFSTGEIKKHLHQTIPLRAKKFAVYLNKERITKEEIIGRRIPVNLKTMFGPIEGEIVIALNPKSIETPGIACKVKQVLIKRESFGQEHKFPQIFNRLCGEVNADFLPILASRTDFRRDSKEYQFFHQLMLNLLTKILEKLKEETKAKSLKKVSKQLREILERVREALELNPDFIPSQRVISRLKKQAKRAKTKRISEKKEESSSAKASEGKEKPATLLVKPEITRRIRLKKLGVSVGIVSLGQDGPESLAEGNLVYINQDHPLYQKFYKNQETFLLHLARIITKEIILMKKLRIPARDAYDYQSKLLTDVFIREKEN